LWCDAHQQQGEVPEEKRDYFCHHRGLRLSLCPEVEDVYVAVLKFQSDLLIYVGKNLGLRRSEEHIVRGIKLDGKDNI
jgi:hypothetical protein